MNTPRHPMTKLRLLVILWLLASVAALSMPLYDLVYLHPALARVMSYNTQHDAKRLALHALHRVLGPDPEELHLDDPAIVRQLDQVRRDLGLLQISLLSVENKLAQSAAPGFEQTAGQIQLRQVLTTGKGMSQPKRVNHVSSAGTVTPLDIMLVTSPIYHGDILIGAFEVVYDWTGQRQLLDNLIGRAATVMLLIPVFFLLMVAFISRQALQAVQEQEGTEAALSASKVQLEIKHRELTDLFHQIELAKAEWQVSMDCIDDMVLLVDHDGHIRRCNEAFRRLIGVPYPDVLGKGWRQVLFSARVEVVSLGRTSFQLYHKDRRSWLNLNFFPYQERGKEGPEWTVITIRATPANEQPATADGPACPLPGKKTADRQA